MYRFILVAVPAWFLVPSIAFAGYEWRNFADDSDQVSLWQDGRQVGNYRYSTRAYHPLRAPGVWGEPCPPPYPPPLSASASAKVEADGTLNFGLDLQRLPASGKHLLNGQEVGKAELLQALGKPALPDDGKWLCLTVIGSDATRKKVLSDLQNVPCLAPWKERFKVRDYPPEHWAVRDAGFVTNGQPTIYCQAADGTVLHRQDEYRGPEALAEVLRSTDPNYRPERDPDLNHPLSNVPPWMWLIGGVILFLLLKGDDQ